MISSPPSSPGLAVCDASLTTDNAGKVLQWSDAAERVLGFPRAEALAQDLALLTTPQDCRSGLRRLLEQTLAEGAAAVQLVQQRPDGSCFWAEFACTRRLTDAGAVVVDWLVQDVTQLRLLQEEKLIRARYRDLLETLPEALLWIDATGHLIHANRAAEAWLGRPQSWLCGGLLEDFVAADRNLTAVCLRLAAIERPEPAELAQAFFVKIRRPDGLPLQAKLSLRVLDGADGAFWIGALQELPEPVTAGPVSSLESASGRPAAPASGALPDSLTVALRSRPLLLIVDDEACIRDMLAAHLQSGFDTLVAENGMLGLETAIRELPDLILSDISMPVKGGLELCRDLRAHEATRETPIVMLTGRADQAIKLDCLAAGANDFIAKPFSAAELTLRVRNLTEMRRQKLELAVQKQQLERALADLQEKETLLVRQEKLAALGRLSAGLIHEINNPLNYALQALHVLRQGLRDFPRERTAEFREVLGDVEEGVTRVTRIIADLRGFTHNNHHSQLKVVELRPMVDAALKFFSHAWKSECELVLEVPADLTVRADPNQFTQVIINLVNNALDAMRDKAYPAGEKPRLSIRASREGDAVSLSIEDNAEGMTEDVRSHIFDPFFTTKDVGRGMGLGLSICHSIASEHGVVIDVQSTPGAGSCFSLKFPPILDGEV